MVFTIAGVIGLGIIPTVVWLIFFEQEHRKHPEPIHAIVLALIAGAVVTFIALFIQYFLDIQLLNAGYVRTHPVTITLFALIEEVLKFMVVFAIIRPNKHFREPLDAMLFMIVAGLGFAAVENVAILFNYGGSLSEIFSRGKIFELVLLRFMGATLLHALVGATIGYHWAVGLLRKRNITLHIIVGLVLATVLHAIFNYLIMGTGPSSWVLVYLVAFTFFILVDFEELKAVDADPISIH